MVTDKIQYGDKFLVRKTPEPPPQLLGENNRGVRGAKHQDCVYCGNIYSFIENINGKNYLKAVLFRFQSLYCR
ncbi:MAG: hypothetical protein BWY39_00763 [Spirochaetes bacterium ADurb.Bin269]|nr:MAG: hypothetical protein BWY39_00763 [Spirochaetes bacterium ADurb.Bin269]